MPHRIFAIHEFLPEPCPVPSGAKALVLRSEPGGRFAEIIETLRHRGVQVEQFWINRYGTHSGLSINPGMVAAVSAIDYCLSNPEKRVVELFLSDIDEPTELIIKRFSFSDSIVIHVHTPNKNPDEFNSSGFLKASSRVV